MNISLKPEIQRRIDEKIESGEFESADAIVEQALMFFLENEAGEMDAQEFRETGAAIDEAIEQGRRGQGISLEEFDQNMRGRYGLPR